jgi:hypothetical protein
MYSRYAILDAYTLEELKREYEAAGSNGRIRILKKLIVRSPSEIAWRAARDSNTKVRQWFARNGHFDTDSGEIVAALLNDPDLFVRACLHENGWALRFFKDDWKQYFNRLSHVERLALVRNPSIGTKLTEQIFDFDDKELGISGEERKELVFAFLSNENRLHSLAGRAWVPYGNPPETLDYVDYWGDELPAQELSKFLDTIWGLASKWPAELENGSSFRSAVAATVFRSVPVRTETRQRIYSGCSDTNLKLNILDGCGDDYSTIGLALRDPDDSCRECAYSMIRSISSISQVEALIQKGDKAALEGLARNDSVATFALLKIRDWFTEHDPDNSLAQRLISSNLADRHFEEEPLPAIGTDSRPPRWSRDWLAEILTYVFPSGRALFFICLLASILKPSFWDFISLYAVYLMLERLDRWHARKEKQKEVDDEIYGWKQDPDDPEYESKGGLSRIKLTGQNQIIVTRVAELLTRML